MLALTEEMTCLLRKCLDSHRPDLLFVIDSSELINVDEDLGNQLREAVLEEFIQLGLKNNDEPNNLGLELEKLIDQIGRLFM